MTYKVDPTTDRQYIEEFRRQPIGHHSPGLMRLLTVMRQDPSGRQVILICRKPFREWVLGEMPPRYLRDTTMDAKTRTLLRVSLPPKGKDEFKHTVDLVESLMGRKAELRYAFIQEKAQFVRDLDV